MILPSERVTIFHSRYQINVFRIDKTFAEDTSTITARGSAGTMVSLRTGDAGHTMHGMAQARKG